MMILYEKMKNKKSCHSTLMDQNCNYHHSLIMLLILEVTKGLLKNIVLKKFCTFICSKILKNIFTAAVMSSNECFKLHDEKLNSKNAPNF